MCKDGVIERGKQPLTSGSSEPGLGVLHLNINNLTPPASDKAPLPEGHVKKQGHSVIFFNSEQNMNTVQTRK